MKNEYLIERNCMRGKSELYQQNYENCDTSLNVDTKIDNMRNQNISRSCPYS